MQERVRQEKVKVCKMVAKPCAPAAPAAPAAAPCAPACGPTCGGCRLGHCLLPADQHARQTEVPLQRHEGPHGRHEVQAQEQEVELLRHGLRCGGLLRARRPPAASKLTIQLSGPRSPGQHLSAQAPHLGRVCLANDRKVHAGRVHFSFFRFRIPRHSGIE